MCLGCFFLFFVPLSPDFVFMSEYSINLSGRLVSLATPAVMAVINITPDSFYESCRSERDILVSAGDALSCGASILDVGGYSSRPGACFVSPEEERRRVGFALGVIRKEFPEAHLSVDTFRSDVAAYAVEQYGVSMVNDISGGTLDAGMFDTVARLGVSYVLMHMRGTPETMQQKTHYDNLLAEITDFFQRRVSALKEAGVKDIILDPGFGFSKTLEQNYELLLKMSCFRTFRLPVMAGLSRKSMVYKLLGITPGESLNGTTVVNTLALLNGADILRVHDVRAAAEAIKIVCEARKYNPIIAK